MRHDFGCGDDVREERKTQRLIEEMSKRRVVICKNRSIMYIYTFIAEIVIHIADTLYTLTCVFVFH